VAGRCDFAIGTEAIARILKAVRDEFPAGDEIRLAADIDQAYIEARLMEPVFRERISG
jgi:hypothetical protein